MVKDSASKDEKKFELFVYLQLTCAALEECFSLVNQRSYATETKNRIDKELRDFNGAFFKDKIPSENLTKVGQYGAAVAGKYIVKEKLSELFVKRGLEYILENMKLLENVDDYGTLKGKTAEKLVEFFGSLTRRYEEQTDKIS